MLKGFRLGIYVTMYIVLVALTGLLNVVILKEFDWSAFWDIEFWIPIAVNNAFYFSAFVITVMLVYDVLEYKDSDYQKIEHDIRGERDKLVTDDFKQQIVNRNFIEKKNVWLQYVNIWLSNLQSRLRHKTVFIMKTKSKELWTKKAHSYERKKATLNDYKTKEWIDNNLIFRKRLGWGFLGWIKKLYYPEITVNEIIYGTVSMKPKKSELERHIIRGQIIKKIIITAISITLSVVVSLLQVERFMSTVSILIALAIMFFTILINVVVGVMAGFKAHKDRMNNATIRFGFVVDYIQGKRYPDAPMLEYVEEKVKEKVEQDDKNDIIEKLHTNTLPT